MLYFFLISLISKEKAQELGLKGWVQNTQQGTVIGVVQGPEEEIEQMKIWLSTIGYAI